MPRINNLGIIDWDFPEPLVDKGADPGPESPARLYQLKFFLRLDQPLYGGHPDDLVFGPANEAYLTPDIGEARAWPIPIEVIRLADQLALDHRSMKAVLGFGGIHGVIHTLFLEHWLWQKQGFIRQPTDFMEALAKRMAKWARPSPARRKDEQAVLAFLKEGPAMLGTIHQHLSEVWRLSPDDAGLMTTLKLLVQLRWQGRLQELPMPEHLAKLGRPITEARSWGLP